MRASIDDAARIGRLTRLLTKERKETAPLRADLEAVKRTLRQSQTDLLAVAEAVKIDIVDGKPVVSVPSIHKLLAALARPGVQAVLPNEGNEK